jgi:hypothetical protein
MKPTVDVPEEYCDLVRRGLGRRGYKDDPTQVRLVLGFVVGRLLQKWSRESKAAILFPASKDDERKATGGAG